MNNTKDVYTCWFDGACAPYNPNGHMGLGAIIFKNEEPFDSFSFHIEASTSNSSNVAEYMALQWVLQRLLEDGLQDEEIHIKGDSKLVVYQMLGRWKMKGGLYYNYAVEAYDMFRKFSNVNIDWIPREFNEQADELSKSALPADVIEKEKEIQARRNKNKESFNDNKSYKIKEYATESQVKNLIDMYNNDDLTIGQLTKQINIIANGHYL